ncbi:L-aspartate oxidase [Arthrobacter woluwensis]|uniref:L-aspartate oxidase n=1 Tax=Arthrobacter woluwensis TaxID=156980 RepID=A0A1H4NBW7_9MICC|nr:FAD-binding protein [Arthrobacter woluwensis]SEB92739.1 L-aspartate oxidase [Arthrobacter woluwensis]
MTARPDLPSADDAATPQSAGRAPSAGLAVVGAGIAGLYATLLAAEAGIPVVLLTRSELEASNSFAAQGGICAVLDEARRAPGDSVEAHVRDTLAAGAGLCDPEAVRILCSGAQEDVLNLERFGVRFDAGPSGDPALGLEAAHSHPRILHVGGDATGAGIVRALVSAVIAQVLAGRVSLVENAWATALLTDARDAGRVRGVVFERDGMRHELTAEGVLLATGGAGRLFARTTNPSGALGEGVGLALEAGAVVTDAEFLQFHPTALRLPGQAQDGWLVSEAVRGEGAVLLDDEGRRFMPDLHPLAELAPRDVVSRAVAAHLAGRGIPDGAVFLDARPIVEREGRGFLARRFPSISAALALAGIDWEREPVPVAPAAHYWMGGVATDLWGRTSLAGLWAAGEVACTGVHGANRLASNSLLEGLVFARRAIEALVEERAGDGGAAVIPWSARSLPVRAVELPVTTVSEDTAGGVAVPASTVPRLVAPGLEALQQLMTAEAGMSRTAEGLSRAASVLDDWLARTDTPAFRHSLLAARVLVAGALSREVSVGAHFRADAPDGRPADPRHLNWRAEPRAVVVSSPSGRIPTA